MLFFLFQHSFRTLSIKSIFQSHQWIYKKYDRKCLTQGVELAVEYSSSLSSKRRVEFKIKLSSKFHTPRWIIFDRNHLKINLAGCSLEMVRDKSNGAIWSIAKMASDPKKLYAFLATNKAINCRFYRCHSVNSLLFLHSNNKEITVFITFRWWMVATSIWSDLD